MTFAILIGLWLGWIDLFWIGPRGPMFIFGFTFGIVAFSVGFWRSVTAKQFRSWLGGAFLMLIGCAIGIPCGIGACIFISEHAAASRGSFGVSAPTYGRAEDVRVISVVVPKLEFGDVQRQILTALFWIGPI